MVKACKGVVIMKKGISQNKVNRMRNLVTGDHNAKTKISSGYETKTIERVEGDVWKERGKTWTIKKGIKQTVNKLDEFRLKNQLPLCCSKCEKSMKPWRDSKAYSHFGFCSNCLSIFEAKMKINGTWKEYKESVQDANYDSWLDEQYAEFKDFLKATKSIFKK